MTNSGEAVPPDEAAEALLAIQRLVNDLIAQALQASEVVTGRGELRAAPATLSGTGTVSAVGVASELTPNRVQALRQRVAAIAAAGILVAEHLDVLEGLISLYQRLNE